MLIRTSKLLKTMVNPLDDPPWDCERFTVDEVWEAYHNKQFITSPGTLLDKCDKNHNIRRIAYFIKRMPIDPIQVDVGIPSIGFYVDNPITDGWHRFYAAILRKDKFINADIQGEIGEINKLK